jgi:hypothetical protein
LGGAGGVAIAKLEAGGEGPASLKELLAKLESAGSGGVSRGPGAAPLRFGEETDVRSAEFATKTLTPSQLRDLEHSLKIGVGQTAPTIDILREAGGLSEFGAEGEGSGRARRLAPRHRDAVQRFFQPR